MHKNISSVLIGLVVVIVIVVGGYALFHKSSKTTTASNPYSSTSQPAAKSTAPKAAASSSGIIQTKSSSSAGQYLADAKGNALYTYGGDKAGVSNCSGACLSSWPVYQASSTTSLPTNVTVIKRSDGTSQYAYKDMPLYTFSGDSSGQATGDGVANFHLAKP